MTPLPSLSPFRGQFPFLSWPLPPPFQASRRTIPPPLAPIAGQMRGEGAGGRGGVLSAKMPFPAQPWTAPGPRGGGTIPFRPPAPVYNVAPLRPMPGCFHGSEPKASGREASEGCPRTQPAFTVTCSSDGQRRDVSRVTERGGGARGASGRPRGGSRCPPPLVHPLSISSGAYLAILHPVPVSFCQSLDIQKHAVPAFSFNNALKNLRTSFPNTHIHRPDFTSN